MMRRTSYRAVRRKGHEGVQGPGWTNTNHPGSNPLQPILTSSPMSNGPHSILIPFIDHDLFPNIPMEVQLRSKTHTTLFRHLKFMKNVPLLPTTCKLQTRSEGRVDLPQDRFISLFFPKTDSSLPVLGKLSPVNQVLPTATGCLKS